jgi:hypothetical protein
MFFLEQRTRQVVLKWKKRRGAGRRSKMAHDKNPRIKKEEKNECNYHTCWTTLQSPFGLRKDKKSKRMYQVEEFKTYGNQFKKKKKKRMDGRKKCFG